MTALKTAGATVEISRRAVCGALSLLLVAVPAIAKPSRPATQLPLPLHNFVNVDLTRPLPAPPPPGLFRLSVVLLDSASITHTADTVTFDALAISKSFGHYMSGYREVGPPEGTIVFNMEHYQASCGWRTVRRIPTPYAGYEVGRRYQPFAFQPQLLQDSFLLPRSQYVVAVDKICEGQPGAAKGLKSVAAAVAAWKDDFSALPTAPFAPMPAPTRMFLPEAWERGPTPHRYRVVATDPTSGNILLLDLANITRDGQTATAQSLALLGPEAQRFSSDGTGVAMLRDVRYDCMARTMTVIDQAHWDRDERLAGQTQTETAPRGANEAPVIKAEIDAACGSAPPDGPDFPSVLAAWHAMRDRWAPSPMDAWIPCLWNHASAESRDAYVTQWTGVPGEKRFQVQQTDAQPLIAACAIPESYADMALDKLRFHAAERATLQRLAARRLEEATILAAWHALDWTERLRFIHDCRSLATSDIEDQLAFKDRFATSLGLRSSDADGRKWLSEYIYAQAWIEGA